MSKFKINDLLEYGRKLLASAPAELKNTQKDTTREWYATRKGVDWDRVAIARKEFFHTGTTRAYLKLVGCEKLIRKEYKDFYRQLDEELRLYDKNKSAR